MIVVFSEYGGGERVLVVSVSSVDDSDSGQMVVRMVVSSVTVGSGSVTEEMEMEMGVEVEDSSGQMVVVRVVSSVTVGSGSAVEVDSGQMVVVRVVSSVTTGTEEAGVAAEVLAAEVLAV